MEKSHKKIKEMTKEEKRVYDKAMKARSREKQKENKTKEQEEARIQEENFRHSRRKLTGFDEISTDKPCESAEESICVFRQWLRASNQPDVIPRETLRELALRTFEAWAHTPGALDSWAPGEKHYRPLFNPVKQIFDDYYGCGIPTEPFEKLWTPAKGSNPDEPITPDQLLPLPALPKYDQPEHVVYPPPVYGRGSGMPSLEEIAKAAAERQFGGSWRYPPITPGGYHYLQTGERIPE